MNNSSNTVFVKPYSVQDQNLIKNWKNCQIFTMYEISTYFVSYCRATKLVFKNCVKTYLGQHLTPFIYRRTKINRALSHIFAIVQTHVTI